jgi:hypothetical protein
MKVYYLFGEEVVSHMWDNDHNTVVQMISLGEGGLYVYDSSEHPNTLLEEAQGWANYMELTLEQYNMLKDVKIKWARKDSATGKGMDRGYCCNDGEAYFVNTSDLIKWLRDRNVDEYNELSDEFLLEEAYAQDEYYHTEWDIEDSDYYYEEQADGTLIEINK